MVLAGREGKESISFLPDVRVTTEPTKPRKRGKAGPVAVAEPAIEAGALTIQAFVAEEHRETFIEIYEDDPERRLVTCIEVLSPSNKRKKSKGRKLYLRKRQSLLLGAVNLVEIDLLRGGERMPMLGKWPDSPYTLLVCRERRGALLQRLAGALPGAAAGAADPAVAPRPGHPHRPAAADRSHLRPLALPPRHRLHASPSTRPSPRRTRPGWPSRWQEMTAPVHP